MKEPTLVKGVRLPVSLWAKYHAIMAHRGGRAWLEKIIEREHRKIAALAQESTND